MSDIAPQGIGWAERGGLSSPFNPKMPGGIVEGRCRTCGKPTEGKYCGDVCEEFRLEAVFSGVRRAHRAAYFYTGEAIPIMR